MRSFGVLWIRISDPRSVWIMVKGTDQSTLVPDLSVPLMHHDPDISWITDPDPDHPKGTHPKKTMRKTLIRIQKHLKQSFKLLKKTTGFLKNAKKWKSHQ